MIQKKEDNTQQDQERESYTQMRSRHAKMIGDLPIFFAFGPGCEQRLMKKAGVNSKDELRSIPGGGVIRQADEKLVAEVFERTSREMKLAMKNEQFLKEALTYQLANHEFSYTGDLTDTFDYLGLDINDESLRQLALELGEPSETQSADRN